MKTEQKHTNGRLRIGDGGYTLFGPNYGEISPETIAKCFDRDNGTRIVACWNACDGIPTEVLIDKTRKGAYHDQAHLLIERDTLRADNARLREALQVIANQAGPFTRKPLPALDYATIGNIARAALAAKGE